jgi:CzcA family heavy metal efflux pump
MLQRILEASLRQRRAVLVLAAAWIAYGLHVASRAPLEVLPDFAPPQADVQTEAPGLSPEQVEQLVTRPIESALGGVPGLETLRSESIQGLSVVNVVFAEGTDPYRVRQLVAESLSDVTTQLPEGVAAPHVSPLTSATMDVLKVALLSQERTLMELRTLASAIVRPRFLMVPGVARVNLFGGDALEIQIQPRLAELQARGISLDELVAAARAAVANPGAGYIDTPNQRIVIEAAGVGASAEAIGQALLRETSSTPLRIADVARVVEAPALAFGDALIDGKPGVLLTISSSYGANTMDVTARLEAALGELAPLFASERVTLSKPLHRPANFVDRSLDNLRETLAIGSALVIAVLVALLRNRRAIAVSLAAIPLSLLSAVIVLVQLGVTLNTMSLGGLAIAIGEVVDDAIIDVENILRRLRQNAVAGQPRGTYAVVLGASLEVRGAVIFATLAVALVFAPLLGLHGLQGKFFAPLALAYLAAVMASLATALVVTPALALALFGGREVPREAPGLQERLRARYRALLLRVRVQPALVAAPLTAAALAAALILPLLGGEFLPDFREGHLVLQVGMAPGTGLAEMRRVGRELARRLLRTPGIATFEQQMGRAAAGEDTWGTNLSEFHVELTPDADADATTDAVRELLEETPGITSEVVTFVGDRISETITGETSEFVVNVFAEDLDLLDTKAAEIARVLERVPGAVDVQGAASSRGPHVAVALRPPRLAALGFRPDEVLFQLRVAFAGVSAGEVQRGVQPIEVVVLPAASERARPDQVAELRVRNAAGASVPLRALAEVRAIEGRDEISHEGARRRQVVTCNVDGRDVASFAAEARQRIARDVRFPSGAFFTVGGTSQARASAVGDLATQSLLGALGVIGLLALAAGHWRNLLLLLGCAPLAWVGGVLAAAGVAVATGHEASLTLGSLVGFVTLFGITLRNAIMILSHYRHLVEVEGREWNAETAVAGAADRVVPVLMTASVTALALLPVAVRWREAGGELDGPMAIVILGGLATSTAVSLLALPWLALRFGSFRATGDDTT